MVEAAAPLLTVRDLNAYYGESHALQGINFSVGKGEVVALLGRNGAGKTTTIKSIMGMIEHRTGSIQYGDKETISLSADAIARSGIAICPEERGIFAALTVKENLLLPPKVADGGMSIDDIYTLFPNIKERSNSPGTKLSGGEQQMLAIGQILRTGASLLLLDEPTEGLAPVIVQQIEACLRKLKGLGFTIVLVEQNFHFASSIADRVVVIENGTVIDQFEGEAIKANTARIMGHLGV